MVAQEMKEWANLEKKANEEMLAKMAQDSSKQIRDWKQRTKSFNFHKEIAKKNFIKARYDQDYYTYRHKQSMDEIRLERAAEQEDKLMVKLQNTMQ